MNSFALAAASALLAVGAAAAFAEDLTKPALATALESGCGPWLKNGARAALAADLKSKGWTPVADGAVKEGDWGRLQVALQETAGKRACNVYYNTAAQPRSLMPATDLIGPWANKTLAGAEIKEGDTVQDKDAVHYRVWVTASMDVMEITYKDKQARPKSDLVLRVENR